MAVRDPSYGSAIAMAVRSKCEHSCTLLRSRFVTRDWEFGIHRVGVAFPEGLKLLPFYENLAKRQLLPFYAHSLSVTFTV